MSNERLSIPIDVDAPIWRYLTGRKFRDLFENSRLYLRSAALFDDTLEATFPNSVAPSEDEMSKRASAARSIDEFASIYADAMARDVYVGNVRPITYVNSWNMDEYENPKMWEAYVGNQNGVAVRSTFRRMIKAIQYVSEEIGIGCVRYVDHLTISQSELGDYEPVLLKGLQFQFEQELRLLACPFNRENLPDFNRHRTGIHVNIDLLELVEEIVLSTECDDDFIKEARAIIERCGIGQARLRNSSLPQST